MTVSVSCPPRLVDSSGQWRNFNQRRRRLSGLGGRGGPVERCHWGEGEVLMNKGSEQQTVVIWGIRSNLRQDVTLPRASAGIRKLPFSPASVRASAWLPSIMLLSAQTLLLTDTWQAETLMPSEEKKYIEHLASHAVCMFIRTKSDRTRC